MGEYSIYMLYIFGFLVLLFRDAEKMRWLGGRKDEETPFKDGMYWLLFLLCLAFLYVLIPQIGFLIDTSLNRPEFMSLYLNQYFGIALLFVFIFIIVIKGFINPTLNFIIALTCNIIITIISWQFATGSYDFAIYPLFGLFSAVIIHEILKHKYEKGNEVLWEIPKVWKILNNRWFLLIFTGLFFTEMVFQLNQLSITTFWLFL